MRTLKTWSLAVAALLLLFGTSAFAQGLQWIATPLDDRGDPIRLDFPSLQTRSHVAAVDGAGALFLAGASNRPGSFPESERRLLVKYGADGVQQWRFIGPAQSDFIAVVVNGAGDAFAVGFIGSGGIEHQYVARISGATGAVMWEATDVPGITTENFGADIVLDPAGNPIVLGAGGGRAAVTRYAADSGAVLWSVQPGPDVPNFQHPIGIERDRDGNVVGITYFGDAPLGNTGSLLFKLDGATGARIWATPLSYSSNGAPFGQIQAFTLDGLGKPTLVGSEVAKFSATDGTLNWKRTLTNNATPSFAFGVTTASNGDILVTGTQGANEELVTTARLGSLDGATVWLSTLDGTDPAHVRQEGRSIAVDAGGNVLVAANPFFAGAPNNDLATLRYAGATGQLLATLRYPKAPGETSAAGQLVIPAGDAAYTVGTVQAPSDLFVKVLRYTGFAAASPPRLFNISTRGDVLTGDDVMIGGFVIGGTTPKTVAIVATGPALASAGIANALADPTLTLVRSSDSAVLATNDNWQDAPNAAAIQSSGFAPADARESAILMTLPPGAYTAIVSGVNGTTGVGLVAVFEVDQPQVPLANISTRGRVLTGNDVLIAGLIVQGDSPQTVAITVAGPSLASAGIAQPLMNPTLTLVRSSDQAVIAVNDDWQSASNADAIRASGFAPADPREPAILVTLPPGAYTAIVRGVNDTTGVAVVGAFAVQ